MRILGYTIPLLLLVGCGGKLSPDSRNAIANEYLTEWFEAHGHTDVVTDEDGMGVGGSPTRVNVAIGESEVGENGEIVAEAEFTIRLPSGYQIGEFIDGVGDTEELAIKDSMDQFTSNILHAVYKGFINGDDEHIAWKKMKIGGKSRNVVSCEFISEHLQTQIGKNEIDKIRSELESAVPRFRLPSQPHWMLIAYCERSGTPLTVVAIIDGERDPAIEQALGRLNWPYAEDAYLWRQLFIVK